MERKGKKKVLKEEDWMGITSNIPTKHNIFSYRRLEYLARIAHHTYFSWHLFWDTLYWSQFPFSLPVLSGHRNTSVYKNFPICPTINSILNWMFILASCSCNFSLLLYAVNCSYDEQYPLMLYFFSPAVLYFVLVDHDNHFGRRKSNVCTYIYIFPSTLPCHWVV